MTKTTLNMREFWRQLVTVAWRIFASGQKSIHSLNSISFDGLPTCDDFSLHHRDGSAPFEIKFFCQYDIKPRILTQETESVVF